MGLATQPAQAPAPDTPEIHVGTIVARGAARHPRREAIVWEDERVTYGELAERTEAIAAELLRRGLGPGARVGLLGRNSVAYAVALLAVARYGLVAVPLNWRLSAEALAATAAKFELDALLFADELAAEAGAIAGAAPGLAAALALDGGDLGASVPDAARRRLAELPAPRRDDLFALISTGGTEGTPKGVEVTNGAAATGIVNYLCVERPQPDDAMLVLPQMFHNPQLYLLPYLLLGAKLVVPRMPSFDAELLLRTIERERVTRFLGVATMMTYLVEAQGERPADLSSLRSVSYGGAPFAPATLRQLAETFDCDFVQQYGQTEAAVLISTLTPDDHRRGLAGGGAGRLLESAGRAVPLMDVRVVGEDGRECPRDGAAVGEIAVRGPSVMRGYWRQPEATAAKLRDGWCWTGDLATWDEDRYLYIVDRRSHMIVSGGENVFPKAVESVIYEHPGVEEAAVIGVPDERWGEVVTAVVMPKPGATVTEDEIASLCARRLAGYMRPRRVELVAEPLPKNPSGKILKRELKQRYGGPVGTRGRRVGEQ